MIELRTPESDELEYASALCLRSKGHWGYNANFIAMCKDELTVTDENLTHDAVIVATENNVLVGVAHVSMSDEGCFLEKLFVDPPHMGKGIGRKLFEWSRSAARRLGAKQVIVEADPDAVPFYKAMHCTSAGTAPSGSILGRSLPRLTCETEPESDYQ